MTLLLACALASNACATHLAEPSSRNPASIAVRSAQAHSYAREIVSSHLFAIQGAELALARSRDTDLRAYAQALHSDHSQALTQTSIMLEGVGLMFASPMLQPRHFRLFTQLQTVNAAVFDDIFRNMMALDHLHLIDLHLEVATEVDEAPLRNFARQALALEHSHLAAAQSLRITPRRTRQNQEQRK